MEYEELKEFIGRRVRIYGIDFEPIDGIITNTASEYDTSSGKEEVEIDADKVFYGVPLDEIIKIEEKR